MKEIFERENIIKGIRRYKKETGATNADMAKQLGISPSYFRRLMKEDGDFGPDKLYRIGLLGIDLNTLIMGLEDGNINYPPSKIPKEENEFLLIIIAFFNNLSEKEKLHVIKLILLLLAEQID